MNTARRDLLRGAVVLTAATWVAPSVVTLDRVAAASGSGTPEVPTVGGGAMLIDPPASNEEGNAALDSDTNTFVWVERQSVTLVAPLAVNRTTGGSFGADSNQAALIPVGTTVCSFYVHGDRLDDNGTLTGSMTFNTGRIIGLIYQTAQLTASNYLGATTTTYFNAPMEASDTIVLSVPATGAHTLSWTMTFGPALDGIRVITDCC